MTLPTVERPVPQRPLLASGVRRLWRDTETLQLGLAAGGAVVVAGLDPASRAVLPLLDGTRDLPHLLTAAAAAGCPGPTATAVLGVLGAAGMLDDAARVRDLPALSRPERDRLGPDLASLRHRRRDPVAGDAVLRQRSRARVVVHGAGRLGAPVAALLATSGVGTVDVVDDGAVRPQDCGVGGLGLDAVGVGRGAEARRLIELLAPSVRTTAVISPDLVLLVPAAGRAVPAAPTGAPYLLAQVVDGTGVVGPLVRPGVSACLRCLDLHRSDRDPDWPALAAQLCADSTELVGCDAGLALMVAAQTVREALALLDGADSPASVGGTLELAPGDWRWRRRSWQVHPDCPCSWETPG